MSLNAVASKVTRHSEGGNLQQYAEQSRNAERFSDVSIKSGNISLSAHRLVLACYSQFFEKLFQSPMREQYQGTVELNELDGESVKNLVDFMYTRCITIKYENVFDLLATAHFLQMNEVCEFCFDYLKTAITVDNWSEILSAGSLYENELMLDESYQFICQNLDAISQSENFKNLTIKDMTLITQTALKTSIGDIATSMYKALTSWILADDANRKKDFPSLLKMLDLHKIPCDFLEDVVASNPLVKENLECLTAVFAASTKQFKEMRLKESSFKIISLGGGEVKSKVNEVYNVLGKKSKTIYPDLPEKLFFSKALQLNKYIYSIGGCFGGKLHLAVNNVYRMPKTEQNWEEVAPMNEKRSCMGAAVFKDCLVVVGGVGSGGKRFRTSEMFVPALKKWMRISSLNCIRSAPELVECNDCLYALGGYDGEEYLSSVERLHDLDGEWEEVAPMKCSRSLFAAVSYNKELYAFGGRCEPSFDEIVLKIAEKYSPAKEKWTSITGMKFKRESHAACLLNGKIFVVGGSSERGDAVKFVECYDPSTDEWSVVGELQEKLNRLSLVAW